MFLSLRSTQVSAEAGTQAASARAARERSRIGRRNGIKGYLLSGSEAEGRFPSRILTKEDEKGCGKVLRARLVSGLARAYTGLGQPEKAAEAARKATAGLQSPELLSQAWNHLGLALASQQRPDLAGAEEALRNAVASGGQLVNVSRYNLADVLWRRKKFAESETLAREALNADPFGPASRNARIVLCQARTDGAPPLPPEVLYEETACSLERMRPAEGKDRQRAEGSFVLFRPC